MGLISPLKMLELWAIYKLLVRDIKKRGGRAEKRILLKLMTRNRHIAFQAIGWRSEEVLSELKERIA